MEATATHREEHLLMGAKAGCSRCRAQSLRGADGYGGRRAGVAFIPTSAPSASMASSAVDPSIFGTSSRYKMHLSISSMR